MADIENGVADRAGLDDVFTEVTSQNIGSRLKDSLGGMCIGALLFFGAFPLLFWNEGQWTEDVQTRTKESLGGKQETVKE